MDRRKMLVVFVIGGLVAAVALGAMYGASGGRVPLGGLVGVLVVIGVALAIAMKFLRRDGSPRRKAAEQAAEAHGFEHDADADPLLHRALLPLPGIPKSGKCSRVLVGSISDRRLRIFQHTYVVNTGQAVIPVHHTAYVCDAPAWPEMVISKRGLFSRLAWALGRRGGLRLEHEPFNTSRRVRTDDEDFAIMLLGPEMQRFLAERPDIAWRIGDGRLAMIYNGPLRFDSMGRSLERLHRFWDLVPPELEGAFASPPVAAYPSPSHG
ncbi:MAG: hypothetical protein GY715_17235 [Planctomycetes bacterium]|nr:hypothetical protein [Planctomycetota bacterium]